MRISFLFCLLMFIASLASGQPQKKAKQAGTSSFHGQGKTGHPNLILTERAVNDIREKKDQLSILNKSYNNILKSAQSALNEKMDVPIPKDAGGGYTHEQHKKNATNMYDCGLMYQVTKKKAYALYVKKMLIKYADMYPTLPLHPKAKKNSPGKLFWQLLNESWWLVHTIQAYDDIYDDLSAKDRDYIETNLFLPMTKFMSEGSPQVFDKIHNHGTWAVTAVGLTGLVLNRNDLVKKSLHGLNLDDKGGFFSQIDSLFSPDGYYTEGPYYQRYALKPFLTFAKALENNKPNLNIFAYRDSVLLKAVETSLQLSYTNKDIFPFNDALKGKTIETPELIFGVNLAYGEKNKPDPSILSIARKQGKVTLNDDGVKVAEALEASKAKPFNYKTIALSDGPSGKSGGVSVLRDGKNTDQQCLVFKYTSQGMGHGHYDRLSIMFYDHNHEIMPDYGSARFLNIEPKGGGGYLKENDTWAKQTVAHNTLVVDKTSQFDADVGTGEKHPSQLFFKDFSNPNFKIISAKENHAYNGVKINRTVALLKDKALEFPVVVDILDAHSDDLHTYDLPFYFKGQIIRTGFDYNANATKQLPFGKKYGYQHLWVESSGNGHDTTSQLSWLKNKRFYTLSTNTTNKDSLYMVRLGANDPNFNLRPQQGFVVRKGNQESSVFVTVIEPHGEFNPIQEYTLNPYGKIKSVKVLTKQKDAIVVQVSIPDKKRWVVCLARNNASKNRKHTVTYKSKVIRWTGPYKLKVKYN